MFRGDMHHVPGRRVRYAAILASTALVGSGFFMVASPAQALDLTFGAAFRIDSEDNPDLNDSTKDGLTQAQLNLSLDGLLDTPNAQLSFGIAGQYQGDIDGPGSGNNTRFANPQIYANYARQAANSSFSLNASVRESDLTRNQAIDDFDENVGHRRTHTLGTGFSVGDSSSLGFSANLTHDDVTYSDDPSGTQVDYRRTRLSTQTRMDLSEVMQLNLGLGAAHYEADDGTDRDSWNADLALNVARPFGVASATLRYTETEGSDRVSLSLGHTFEMPRGTQSLKVGMSRGPSGDYFVVGSLGLQLATPNGGWTASLDRGFSAGETTDSEALFTRVSMNYNHALSPVAGLQFDVNFAERETLSSGNSTTRAEIGASYSRSLTQNWSMNVGVRHRERWQDPGSDDSTNSAFFELRHTLSVRR